MKTIEARTALLTGEALNWMTAQVIDMPIGAPHESGMLIHGVGPKSIRQGVPQTGVCYWEPTRNSDQLHGLQEQYLVDVNHAKGRSEHLRWQALTDSKLSGDRALQGRACAFGQDMPTAILRAIVEAHYGEYVQLPAVLAACVEPETKIPA